MPQVQQVHCRQGQGGHVQRRPIGGGDHLTVVAKGQARRLSAIAAGGQIADGRFGLAANHAVDAGQIEHLLGPHAAVKAGEQQFPAMGRSSSIVANNGASSSVGHCQRSRAELVTMVMSA